MRSHPRRDVLLGSRDARVPPAVVVAVMVVLVVAGVIVWWARREPGDRHTSQSTAQSAAATIPATAQTVAASKPAAVAKAWLDVVRAAYVGYPATQPLDFPADLHDAARVVIPDPIHLCGRQDLWVTRPDADPTPEVLKRAADEQVHVLRERVLFVHWMLDRKGKPQASIVVPGASEDGVELVSTDARHSLSSLPNDVAWNRAIDWNDDAVLPTSSGVAVLHLGAKDGRAPDVVSLLHDAAKSKDAPVVQIALGGRGLIAWIPWDNGKPGSKGAARYGDGKWTKLDASNGWPEKVVHVMMLLDGSVARLFVGNDGQLDVSIAPFDASAANANANAPPVDEGQVTTLVEQLSSVEADKRKEAYAQLTRYGPGIFPLLERLAPRQPPEARARIEELLKARITPMLGGVTLNPGPVLTAARLRDGGVVLYADTGVTDTTSSGEATVVAPAWIGIRPNWPVRLLPEAMVHELTPGKQTVDATLDEWVVTDDVQGPRRFVGNHFELLMRKADRARFTEWAGLDRRGRWLFRPAPAKDAKSNGDVTLLVDPTIPDPTPRLPVWNWPTDGGKVGWTVENWPAVQKGGTWVLGESGWRPLDPQKETFNTDLPEAPPVDADPRAAATAADPSTQSTTQPATAPTTTRATTSPTSTRGATSQPITLDGEYPILTGKDGTRYYDGQKSLKIRRPDGRVTTWELPPSAVGAADAWFVHAGDRFFLFNQAGRMLRLMPTGDEAEPFKVDAVFTRNIPNTDSPQRVWLDPAGRIIIAHGSNVAILFPTGRIPKEIAQMMTGGKDEDE